MIDRWLVTPCAGEHVWPGSSKRFPSSVIINQRHWIMKMPFKRNCKGFFILIVVIMLSLKVLLMKNQ